MLMPKLKYIKKYIFPLLSILTIGFPFVGYKILAGILLFRMYDSFFAALIAVIFVSWGIIDLFLNTISFYTLCWRGHNEYPVCLFSVIARKNEKLSKWNDSGEALDIMLSFCIVAWVVGNNLFPFMDGAQVKFWNICTVVNVLGAGIARLGASITAEKNEEGFISDIPSP